MQRQAVAKIIKNVDTISSLLFSLYINDLVELIDNTEMGVNINSIIVNVLLYADDVVLIAKDRYSMQKLLTVVENFGKSNYIKFNPTKTCYTQLDGPSDQLNKLDNKINLQMNNIPIERVQSMKYLGCLINTNLTNNDHINNRTRLAYAAAAELYNKNDFEKKKISGLIKIQQFKTYIRSILHFGTENYKLNQEEIDSIRKTEMNILKCTLNIWNRTHNKLFLKAANIHSTESRLKLSSNKFLIRFLSHPYTGTFAMNLVTAYGDDQNNNSILNKFQTCETELERLQLICKQIEIEKKIELKETKRIKTIKKSAHSL